MEDTCSGRLCREKITGEISAYPGLGEGRIGKVYKYNIPRLCSSKLRPAGEGLVKGHKTTQLGNLKKSS